MRSRSGFAQNLPKCKTILVTTEDGAKRGTREEFALMRSSGVGGDAENRRGRLGFAGLVGGVAALPRLFFRHPLNLLLVVPHGVHHSIHDHVPSQDAGLAGITCGLPGHAQFGDFSAAHAVRLGRDFRAKGGEVHVLELELAALRRALDGSLEDVLVEVEPDQSLSLFET